MKRIQIIFLLLITLTVLSVLSGREDSGYYSEYDTRFTCSLLKYDFKLLDITQELKPENSQKELSQYTFQNVINTNDHQKTLKKVAGIKHRLFPVKLFYSDTQNQFIDLNQNVLFPSRAPPFYS